MPTAPAPVLGTQERRPPLFETSCPIREQILVNCVKGTSVGRVSRWSEGRRGFCVCVCVGTVIPDRESKIRAMLMAKKGPDGPFSSPNMTLRTACGPHCGPHLTPGKRIEGAAPKLKRVSEFFVTNNHHNKKPKQTTRKTTQLLTKTKP